MSSPSTKNKKMMRLKLALQVRVCETRCRIQGCPKSSSAHNAVRLLLPTRNSVHNAALKENSGRQNVTINLLEADKQRLVALVDSHKAIVFFGGAGVSTESGIPDFRSATGIFKGQRFEGYRPEEIVSHSFFKNHTRAFYDFYCEKMIFLDAQPNQAHRKLALLEAEGRLSAIVTQNIDGLHQAAGSRRVLELHGSVHRNYCERCGRHYGIEALIEGHAGVDNAGIPSHYADANDPGIPFCPECGGVIRSDVVLYEEPLDEQVILRTVEAITRADLLIVAGTSLNVYPAAGFLQYFGGDTCIIINLAPTPFDHKADLLIEAPVGQVFDF
jgi:NAD-dependent deacetylase